MTTARQLLAAVILVMKFLRDFLHVLHVRDQHGTQLDEVAVGLGRKRGGEGDLAKKNLQGYEKERGLTR